MVHLSTGVNVSLSLSSALGSDEVASISSAMSESSKSDSGSLCGEGLSSNDGSSHVGAEIGRRFLGHVTSELVRA